MSDCSSDWKLPKKFPASVHRMIMNGEERFGICTPKKNVLVSRFEAECILADLMVLLKEVEFDDRR